MTRTFLAAALLAMTMTGGAVQAQTADSPLRDALAALPLDLMTEPDPKLAAFIDVPALAALNARAQDGKVHHSRVAFATNDIPLQALMSGSTEDWRERAGVDRAEIRYFADFGQPPYGLTIWGLNGPGQAQEFLSRLTANGFTALAAEDGLYANGTPMKMDITRKAPLNPWFGQLGQASVIAVHGDALLQSRSPDPVTRVLAAERSLLDLLEPAVTGIEHAARNATVVQAGVYSPHLGLSSGDMATIMTSLPNEVTTEDLRRQIEQNENSGLPLYLGAIIADLQSGDTPGLAISLAYSDCDTAEQVGMVVADKWSATIGQTVAGEITAETVPGQAGNGCAAVLSVTGDAGDQRDNPLIQPMLADISLQTFGGILGIRTAP